MTNILVVTGSVRPNSVNEKVVPLVTAEIEKQGATATIADLKTLALPFLMHRFLQLRQILSQQTSQLASGPSL